jgi:hypothetical protein
MEEDKEVAFCTLVYYVWDRIGALDDIYLRIDKCIWIFGDDLNRGGNWN